MTDLVRWLEVDGSLQELYSFVEFADMKIGYSERAVPDTEHWIAWTKANGFLHMPLGLFRAADKDL